MKTGLTALLLLTVPFGSYVQPQTPTQPLDILLIGALHDYGKTPVEHFSYPLGKAVAFRPDAVFSEDLSPADYDALTDYWNKAAVEARLAYIRDRPYTDPTKADQFIRQTYQLLRANPTRNQERMKLARALYMTHDFGNARYQLYQLDRAKPGFSNEDRQAYRAVLGEPDSLYRSRSSEYHTIFFPLLDKLKQDRILPMDCQKHDLHWQAAWNNADSLFRRWETSLRADTNSVAARRYAVLTNRRSELNKQRKQAEVSGTLTQFMNAPAGEEFLSIANFYGAQQLAGVAGFPDSAFADMLHYWQLRNEGMCQNLVTRARLAGAKRVVVGVGANHRTIMVDLLRAMPNVRVYTLNEYQPEGPRQKQ